MANSPDTRASNDAAYEPASEDVAVLRTILIVDDHDAFRASARLMLELEGFSVVGEAANGASAISEAERLRPAIVLLDIQLPDSDGFRVAERLASQQEPPDVVLISSRLADSYGNRIAGSSARGFLAKADLTGDSLIDLLA